MKQIGRSILPFLLITTISTLIPPFQSVLPQISTISSKPLDFSVMRSPTSNYNFHSNLSPVRNSNRLVFRSSSNGFYSSLQASRNFDPFGSRRHSKSIVELSKFSRLADGQSNNLQHPEYGRSNSKLARSCPAFYKDNISEPIPSDYSSRQISNALGRAIYPLTLNPDNVTMAFTIWGQFIDHDMTLTEVNQKQKMDIQIPKCDPFMDVECKGDKYINFKRSHSDQSSPRDQMNSITHWIDASMIYGSSKNVSERLRQKKDGKLKIGKDNMLPPLIGSPHNLPDAGDQRAAQNLFLASYHTVFLREHNRLCDILMQKDSNLTDEQLYQAAKNYVTGLIQKITYYDFLPVLLGYSGYQKYIGSYRYYDPKIDPAVQNQFSTAAFRFGHSLLVDRVPLINKYGDQTDQLNLHKIFFRPDILTNNKIDYIFRGLAKTITKKRDGTIIDDIRNLLITDPQKRHINLDLYALNVQRAKDHGLQKYNTLRKVYGIKPLSDFSELTKDPERAKLLQQFYNNDINKVDAWVGILNEQSLEGGVIGQLGATIIGRTFRRLRDGDRFWFENSYPNNIISEIKGTFLSEVIIRNTGINMLEEDIFHHVSDSRQIKI